MLATTDNPFPGMNPYLQEYWSDVHNNLLTFIAEALGNELPADLSARTEERVAVTAEDQPQTYRADVAVVEPWRAGFPPVWQPEGATVEAVTVAEPLIVHDDPIPERWVEIRDVHGRLVTVLEVLSPANKREDGWLRYRARQRNFLSAPVNLVEIDLIRGGSHVAAVPLDQFARPPATSHLVCVARPSPADPTRRELYLCPLREPLPTIRVPLRPTDPDVPLALQALIDRCYRTGRYWLSDHRRPLDPPVAGEDAAWIEERVRAAGLR